MTNKLNTVLTRLQAKHRIGPHSQEALSVLYGTLLGDAHLEQRVDNVRISFQQENSNVEYLMWLWSTLRDLGYCSEDMPKLHVRTAKNGKVRRYYKLHTWTYSSLNFMMDEWYRGGIIKRVPLKIEEYLTPLALACWAMDDGARVGSGFKFCTNGFLLEDVQILLDGLRNRYGLTSTIQSAGAKDQYYLYIWAQSMSDFRAIVKPHMVQSMWYKIGC